MGKTVLLDAYRKAAESADWVVITESSSDGILHRLTSDHLPRLLQRFADKPRHKLTSADLTVGPGGVGASWIDRYPAESTLRAQIAELTDTLAPTGRGLLITVDEVQSADIEELRKLGEIIQYARREERPLAFAAAGLSTPVEELLDHPGATFLRRAEHHSVGPVGRADVDRTYLLAMAQDAGPSRTRDIAERMHVTTDYAAQYRRRLIRDGIIDAAGHGVVRFAIPYMAEHLREHAAHDVLDRMDPEDPASAGKGHAQV